MSSSNDFRDKNVKSSWRDDDTTRIRDGHVHPKSASCIPTQKDSPVCTNFHSFSQESKHDASCLPNPIPSNVDNVNGIWDFHQEVEIGHSLQALHPSDTDSNIDLSTGRPGEDSSSLPKEKVLGEIAIYQAILSLVLVGGVVVAIFLYRAYCKSKKKAIQPQTKEEHRGIIDFTPVGQERIHGKGDRQTIRARPNERLGTVFGIANAFTTRDLGIHAKFLNAARKKMQNAVKLDGKTWEENDGDWGDLKALARSSVQQILTQPEESLRIVDLVRVVTLKVSLRILFDVSDADMNSERSTDQLILIGQRINDLWIASKYKSKPVSRWNSRENSDIHEALIAVCQSDAVDEVDPLRPEANPMNWLLPTYETMWRVVLACIIELRFRNAENADIWCKKLEGYISDTSSENFKGTRITPGVRGFCVNDIVKETLRLYPPTRRVYRRFTELGEDVKADIESCHRSNAQDAFGPDALQFRPERWLGIRAHLCSDKRDSDVKVIEEERGFMPFAIFCPAGQSSTQGFGLKMIALLAGVLCEGLNKSKEWVLEDEKAYQDLRGPLPSDRAAFDDVYLIKNM